MITYAMMSRDGKRPENEDTIRMCHEDDAWLFILADGLGGCGHGQLASSTAADGAVGRFRWDKEKDGFLPRCMDTMQDAVSERQKVYPETKDMSTTAVLLRIDGNSAGWLHVGDSRLYMFRNGQIAAQSVDHSVPQMLVNMGEITPDQIRSHPDRSRLLSTLGRPWESKPYRISAPVTLEPGDAFLLCSDGFWEYIEEEYMCSTLQKTKTVQQWLKAMTDIVENAGKDKNMDNYSAICVRA